MATGERRSVWNVPRSDLIRQERRVAIRPGYEGSGKARFGRHGWAMHGRERLGGACSGMERLGRIGGARYVSAWCCLVSSGAARTGMAGQVRFGGAR